MPLQLQLMPLTDHNATSFSKGAIDFLATEMRLTQKAGRNWRQLCTYPIPTGHDVTVRLADIVLRKALKQIFHSSPF